LKSLSLIFLFSLGFEFFEAFYTISGHWVLLW
jgi:hypothetical protein